MILTTHNRALTGLFLAGAAAFASGGKTSGTAGTPGDIRVLNEIQPAGGTVQLKFSLTATFTPVFGLSIGRGGNGTVTADQPGVFSTQIACGSSCSAKFAQGTSLTLTATPPAGHVFVNWGGACAGTAPTCSLTITSNTQAQANFK